MMGYQGDPEELRLFTSATKINDHNTANIESKSGKIVQRNL